MLLQPGCLQSLVYFRPYLRPIIYRSLSSDLVQRERSLEPHGFYVQRALRCELPYPLV